MSTPKRSNRAMQNAANDITAIHPQFPTPIAGTATTIRIPAKDVESQLTTTIKRAKIAC